jgi:hypothetical protein
MYDPEAGAVRPFVTAYGRTIGPASRSSHLSLGALMRSAHDWFVIGIPRRRSQVHAHPPHQLGHLVGHHAQVGISRGEQGLLQLLAGLRQLD